MNVPRMRMLAGPNGSGKSTLFDYLQNQFDFDLGFNLNPDELDRQLKEDRVLHFDRWDLRVTRKNLLPFIRSHPLFPQIGNRAVTIRDNSLVLAGNYSAGYLASILSDFMRRSWIASKRSFTFETVMSNVDKVQLLKTATNAGYRTYLYYICTDVPTINEQRILNRVKRGGHPVPAQKIKSRYARSLQLLPQAIQHAHRAYLFDNSGKRHRLVAEFENARLVAVEDRPPNWVAKAISLDQFD